MLITWCRLRRAQHAAAGRELLDAEIARLRGLVEMQLIKELEGPGDVTRVQITFRQREDRMVSLLKVDARAAISASELDDEGVRRSVRAWLVDESSGER